MNAKKIFGFLVYYTGVYGILKLLARPSLIVFVYHRVAWQKGENLDPFVKSASPVEFEKQVRFIKENFYLTSFEKLLNEGIKKRPAIITFDDGYLDNYLLAYPILKRYNCPATILLTTGYIDSKKLPWWDRIAYSINTTNKEHINTPVGNLDLNNKNGAIRKFQNIVRKRKDREMLVRDLEKKLKTRLPRTRAFLNWNEVKEMSENQISFGAHTVNHPILTNIPLHLAKKEISRSKTAIEGQLMKRVIVFAYPNGEEEDMNNALDRFLKKLKLKFSLTANFGKNVCLDFRIKRVGIEYDDTLEVFKFKTLGLGKWIASIYMGLRK